VFDRVGDVDLAPVDAHLLERLIEETSGRTDEWLAFNVLAVARLLADEHDLGMLGALPEDRLGAGLVKVAGATTPGRLAQRGQRAWLRKGQDGGYFLAASSGRLNVNSLPSPGFESALMSPPWRRASSRAR